MIFLAAFSNFTWRVVSNCTSTPFKRQTVICGLRVCAIAITLFSGSVTTQGQSPPTGLISVNRFGTGSGNQAVLNNALSVSADGRFVAFVSDATNLTPNDTNNASDVFVRDRQTNQTTLVSVNAAGTGSGDGYSNAPRITPDGRFVAFISASSNLVSDDAATLIHEDQGLHGGGVVVSPDTRRAGALGIRRAGAGAPIGEG